jgi:hypothetical protein
MPFTLVASCKCSRVVGCWRNFAIIGGNGGKVAEYLADKIKVFIFVARNG